MRKIFVLIPLFLMLGFATGAGRYNPFVSRSKCVGCGDCVAVCPVKAIELVGKKAVIDPDKCVGCMMCTKICSWGAVK